MQLVGNGEELLKPTDDDVLGGVALRLVVVTEHLGTGVEQEETKQTQNPFEALDHSGTGENKDTAQYQGSEDAPEQDFVLVFTLDAEEREQHEEHEEVVHRQRLLDEIAG